MAKTSRHGIGARISLGAKPADLPVELPTVFEQMVNLKRAEALGVTIPGAIPLIRFTYRLPRHTA